MMQINAKLVKVGHAPSRTNIFCIFQHQIAFLNFSIFIIFANYQFLNLIIVLQKIIILKHLKYYF